MNNFDLHEWNKKRYLGKLQESDDPKMGAELEGDPNEKVEEGWNDRVLKAKLSDLNYDVLTTYFNGKSFSAPNPDDSLRRINGEWDWDSWKQKTVDRYGDVDVELDNTAVWFDQFKIIDPEFIKQKDASIAGKAAWLDKERAAGRTSGLD